MDNNLFLNEFKSMIAASATLAVASSLAAAASPAFAGEPAARAPSAVYPFAMCSNGNMLDDPEYPVKMLDTGARMCRLDASFATIRKFPGNDPDKWDWTTFYKAREVRLQHPDLQLELILGYGTAWAEDPKFKDSTPVPKGETATNNDPQAGITIMPVTDPRNLYGNYVYETVKRFKDVTKYWESWNEPDLHIPEAAYFKGTGKDFFAYQKACYLAAKQADPDCVVLFAGLAFARVESQPATNQLNAARLHDGFFEEYLKECVKDPEAKKHHFYFDIMNQHSYNHASNLYDYTESDRKLMQAYLGEVKPIWITETGTTDDGPSAWGCTPEEYCDYLLQAYAWGELAGVQRFFHFQLDNSNGFGLYNKGFDDPKPALITYRDVLVKEFADARFVKQLHGAEDAAGNPTDDPGRNAGYDVFEFRSRDGSKHLLLAFADTNETVDVKLPATKARATLITRNNQRSEIQAKDGQYEVELQGATNVGAMKDNKAAEAMGEPQHLVGGATVVLVEQ